MTNRKKSILGFIFALGVLSSCEEWRIERSVLKAEDLIIVNTTLNPSDSVIKVYVGRGSTNYQKIELADQLFNKDASVTLISGTKKQKLLFSKRTNFYEIKSSVFPILEGQSYSIEVVVGDKKAIAECTIPKKVEQPTLNCIEKEGIVTATVSWKSSEAFQSYKLKANSLFFSGITPVAAFGTWDFEQIDLINASSVGQNFKQTTIITPTSERNYAGFIEIVCEISAYDKNAINFYNTTKSNSDVPKSSTDFFEKFTSPAIRYTNIKGGLGIMAAVNNTIIVKKVLLTKKPA